MSSNGHVRVNGIGFPGLLTILFIALKLTGYINWSWWWVLSPIWVMITLVILVFIVASIFTMKSEGISTSDLLRYYGRRK